IKGDLYRGSLLNFWCVRPEAHEPVIHIVTKNEKLRQNPNLGVSNARKKFLIGKIWPYLKYKITVSHGEFK
uniref:hypothetical protein n=1 Tax=Parasutterella sp. TaxID=2049037 RepID=UPI003078AF7D